MSAEVMGSPLGTVLVLALVGLLPFAFMALTSFVKIATVLSIVRGAIGAQSVPSSTVVLALSAALTLIAMAPVGAQVAERLQPLLARSLSDPTKLISNTIDAVREPLRGFLAHNSSAKERERFLNLARKKQAGGTPAGEDDLMVVVPAFLVTELLEAFSLGFAIYLPFLVIDLVVANVLIGLGMQTLNPNQISLPFKLLLFVAADGWGLLAESLVTGYVT
ncbi:MAG: flagellar type III secretion system pore protein FliP [Deltaproteobacteria bacterium]